MAGSLYLSFSLLVSKGKPMTPGKLRALRLALYLCSIHILPVEPNLFSYKKWLLGLQIQYDHLEPEQRRLARMEGRRLVKEYGSVKLAAASIPIPLLQKPSFLQTISPNSATKENSSEVLRCPSCRMHGGRHKRLWPSFERAEQVRRLQHDRDTLNAYACPVMPGSWHLGHLRPSARPSPIVDRESVGCQPVPAVPAWEVRV
jgi:hypothetical protein